MAIVLCIIVFSCLWLANAPVRDETRRGREHWQKTLKDHDDMMAEIAAQRDCYHIKGYRIVQDGFYPDGSVKRDSKTGRTYPRGQYFVNSSGMTADMRHDDTRPRAPQ